MLGKMILPLMILPKFDPFMVNLHGEPHRAGEENGKIIYGQNNWRVGRSRAYEYWKGCSQKTQKGAEHSKVWKNWIKKFQTFGKH